MKVQINIDQDKMKLQQTFTGTTEEDIVNAVKARISQDLPFAMRLVVGSMPPLTFAREVVTRYNQSKNTNYPIPATCAEFLSTAEQIGVATVLER